MPSYTVLVWNNDAQELETLCNIIKTRFGNKVVPAQSEAQAREMLRKRDRQFDLILVDISRMDHPFGRISALKMLASHIPIVAIVQYGDYEFALDAIKYGAQDFLTKPIAIERLRVTFDNMVLLHRLLGTRDQSATPAQDPAEYWIFDKDGQIRKFCDIEKNIIQFALKHYDGCMSKVARSLGVGRSTLYRKVQVNRKAT